MSSNEEREQRYARAIFDDQIVSYDPDEVSEVTEAVMAVADAEQAELWTALMLEQANAAAFFEVGGKWRGRALAAEDKVARVEAVVNDEFGFTYDNVRAALAGE